MPRTLVRFFGSAQDLCLVWKKPMEDNYLKHFKVESNICWNSGGKYWNGGFVARARSTIGRVWPQLRGKEGKWLKVFVSRENFFFGDKFQAPCTAWVGCSPKGFSLFFESKLKVDFFLVFWPHHQWQMTKCWRGCFSGSLFIFLLLRLGGSAANFWCWL